MLFNSPEYFLFLFVVFLIYWATGKRRMQNWLIVVASYFFYACWDWRFLSLIVVTTLSSWWTGLLMERYNTNCRIRLAVVVSNVLLNLSILGTFKYFNFFALGLVDLLSVFGIAADYPTLHLILPVGISFYTFQAVGYSIDVYVRRLAPCRSLPVFAAFISFFPQLVAGPIESASHLLPQLQSPRRFRYAEAVDGCRMILWGLFKKMAVADNCAVTVDMVWGDYANASSVMLAVASLLFSVQIYCDFSGYSDIAIGSAKLFGIDLIQNFKLPYFSLSIPEFWRRWHVSLMNWLRTYIYIPLGGSRHGRLVMLRNVFVVFAISGLWHGDNYTFIVWGLYHAALSMPYILLGKRTKRATEAPSASAWQMAAMLSTFLLVTLGWVFFRAPDMQSACGYLSRMFSAGITLSDFSGVTAIAVSMVCLAVEWFQRNRAHALDLNRLPLFASPWVRMVVYYAILLSLFELSAHKESFIYFQF